jgi:hypothetical protein
MGTLNKDRQAAFKQRMREAGLRQATYWVSPDQEVRIKSVLSGEAQAEPISQPSPDDLAHDDARLALAAERQHLEERAVALDQREQALARRERTAKAKTDSPRSIESPVDSTQLIAQLVSRFTTNKNPRTGQDEPIEEGWKAAARGKSLATLARDTSAARTILHKLLAVWRSHDLLADADIDQLTRTAEVLDGLGRAAAKAKSIVTSNAQAVEAKDEARTKLAKQAVASAFTSLSVEDWVLWAHVLKLSHDYHLSALAQLRPRDLAPKDLHYHVRNLQEEVTRSLEDEIKTRIKAGQTPGAATDALRAIFLTARPTLAAQHAEMLDRLRACQVAADLSPASGHEGQGVHAR